MAALMPEIGQTERMWGKSTYAHPGVNLGTGNRCGHNPEQFAADRLALPKVKGGHLPAVLKKAIKRSADFFADPAVVSRLGYHKHKRNKDGSRRQVRSENREAVVLVLHAILSAIDLASLRVGHYRSDGSFRNYTCDELAARVSMTTLEKHPEDPANPRQVASSRWWRALAWLKDAAGIKVFEQYEDKDDGTKRARAAIKTMDEKFLMLLARYPIKAMKKAREAAYKRISTFLGRAPKYNVQTVQERERLNRELDHTPTAPNRRKNLAPSCRDATSPMPLHSTDALVKAYTKYVEEFTQHIIEAEGRHPGPRLARLFTAYGGLSREEFELQQLKT